MPLDNSNKPELFSQRKSIEISFVFRFTENLPVDRRQIKIRNAKTAITMTIIGIPAGEGSKLEKLPYQQGISIHYIR